MEQMGDAGTEEGKGRNEGEGGERTIGKQRREVRHGDREPDSAWKPVAAGLDRRSVEVQQTGVFCC